MSAEGRMAAVRAAIGDLLSEYLSLVAVEVDEPEEMGDLVTEWVAVVGATRIEWDDGRQTLITVHPNVPYSARLGLLTSAQHDLVST